MTIYQHPWGSLACHGRCYPMTEDRHFKWSPDPQCIWLYIGLNPGLLCSKVSVLPLDHSWCACSGYILGTIRCIKLLLCRYFSWRLYMTLCNIIVWPGWNLWPLTLGFASMFSAAIFETCLSYHKDI